jgi:MoxR-like ATPase
MHDTDTHLSYRLGDTRDGSVYLVDQRIALALKVSLITGRPLLLTGPPGCGKSSLAPFVARNLGLRYYSYTVTSDADVGDLLWRLDLVKRLNDAQAHMAGDTPEYLEKGVLWKAFEPDPGASPSGSLVLIDEIDKAESSFTNSLLVATGSLEFEVPPLGRPVQAPTDLLVVLMLTSNEERELPPALMRRCISLRINYPTADQLVEITRRRWQDWMADDEFCASVTALAEALAGDERSDSDPRVSTAEFLDLVQVLREGSIPPDSDDWNTIKELVLLGAPESDDGFTRW